MRRGIKLDPIRDSHLPHYHSLWFQRNKDLSLIVGCIFANQPAIRFFYTEGDALQRFAGLLHCFDNL